MVVTALVLNLVVAHAFGPYTSTQSGYDVGWPQCPGTTPPTVAGVTFHFGIVGVNHGRPFTPSGCLGTEYSTASGFATPSLYMNAAYAGAYRKNITSACASGPNLAWEIGCSEADYSLQQASGLPAAMWWIDVETANSWSSSNHTLNQQAIDGAISRLLQANANVGVYSTSAMWKTITGNGFTPVGSVADWVAAGNCSTPFDTNQVWLTQTTTSGVDADTAC